MDWENVYREHGRKLTLYARQWLPSIADSEDAVQEAFLKVYRKADLEHYDVVPLLYNAVKWCSLDRIRSDGRRRKRENKSVAESEKQVELFDCTLEHEELRGHIQDALETLPLEQREVLVMKIWGDLSFRQISEAMDIPLNTAASRYRYALEALRGKLKKEHVA